MALAAALLASCKPAARGLCSSSAQCRAGASCSEDGICLAASGQCSPVCADGEICSSGECQPLKPVVTLAAPTGGVVSPARNAISVTVAASPQVPLGALTVQVFSDHQLASATLDAPQPGQNALVLAGFEANFEGQVTLVATLEFEHSDGTPDAAQSVTVPATYDSAPPSVTSIFFPPGQGQVAGGWFPPVGPDVQVSAQVTDGAQGSGPQSATLLLDVCTLLGPCSYEGSAPAGTAGAAATYSFALPRSLQPEGSEAPIGFHVQAVDRAGNAVSQAGQLLIDHKPPAFGVVQLVSAGAPGEDGHTWFAAGASAPPVEVSIGLQDSGAGLDLATIALTLEPADVDVNPGPLGPLLPLPTDGTVHFRVPATVVTSREGQVRFAVAARDNVGQAASLPAGAANALYLDALPPQVTLAAVDYTASTPAWSNVCGAAQVAGAFECGRGPESGPLRALRDDTVTAFFTVADCGVGLSPVASDAVGSFTLTSGGQLVSGNATPAGTLPTTCTNGSANLLRRYSFTLGVGSDLPVLDAPDAAGVVHVLLTTLGKDLLGHVGSALPIGVSPGGPGALEISLVRWRRMLSAPATGAPLLTLAPVSGGNRSVAVATGANLFAVRPSGAIDTQYINSLPAPVLGDLALGPAGNLYGAIGASGVLIVPPGATATPISCTVANLGFSAPPAVVRPNGSTGEFALAVPSSPSVIDNNVYAFSRAGTSSTCTQHPSRVTSGLNPLSFTGVTAGSGLVFFSHSAGFSSATLAASGSVGAPEADSQDTKDAALAPPALNGQGSFDKQQPIYPASDSSVRSTRYGANCAGGNLTPACWLNAWTATGAGVATAAVSVTPVFDDHQVVASDANGSVTSWDLTTGLALWQTGPAGAPTKTSGPVLLRSGSSGGAPGPVLVVDGNGHVRRLSTSSAHPSFPNDLLLLVTAAATGTPLSPVVDTLGGGGVAYLTDGSGWLYALQLDDAPVLASSKAWPRPSRDSCNSRSADSSCQ